jgi:hypothetical protein
MNRALAACVLAGLCLAAAAHDLITAESAQDYLAAVAELQKTIASNEPAAVRARAHLDLGKSLDEIREFLNRDLAAHGEVRGLPSNYLVAELERRSVPLAYSPRQKRYLANTKYFAEALRLSPHGAFADDAAFRLFHGTFYDSFDADPLESGESWKALREQIALGESLAGKSLPAEQREEADFILAVRYVRAAGRAPDAVLGRGYAEKARTALGAFQQRYPDSLRAAAVPVLLDALESKR